MAANMPERLKEQRREVVERIAEDMEKGGFEWTKPWQNTGSPHNPVTGTSYAGGNRLHLAVIAAARGYDDPRWVTFRQAQEAGWRIRTGAKSAAIERWRMFAFKDKDAPDVPDDKGEGTRLVPRCVGYWSVFNACEIDGMPPLEKPEKNSDVEIGLLADEIIESSRCPVRERDTDTACFYPAYDMIDVPYRDCFASNEAFLGVLLHEMGHSTGHPSALDRDLSGGFGSASYAREELIAELSSLFCASDFGLDAHADSESEHYRQHVAYLSSWTKALREDPDALFQAASAAEKASGYIIGRYEEATGREIRPKAREKEAPQAERAAADLASERDDLQGADIAQDRFPHDAPGNRDER